LISHQFPSVTGLSLAGLYACGSVVLSSWSLFALPAINDQGKREIAWVDESPKLLQLQVVIADHTWPIGLLLRSQR
jgi:hypothetical protein